MSFPSSKPYIHLIKHQGINVLLDLHTNRIFLLDLAETKVVDMWLANKSWDKIACEFPKEAANIQNLQKEGAFCARFPEGLSFGSGWEENCHKILHQREITLIDITQRCNLRCRYCTFGGWFKGHRMHNTKTMSVEMLEKCVESAFKHSDELDDIAFGFYGGEPLLAFNMVKKAVNLIYKKAPLSKKIRFSLTTNATLIDLAKARFMRDSGFTILVSLDGPQYMHDRYRVFKNGEGSYSSTIKGLKVLSDVYQDEFLTKVSLNMLVPTSGWMRHLQELWDQEPWLPRRIRAKANPFRPPEKLKLPDPPLSPFKNLKDDWFESLETKKDGLTNLGKTQYDTPLVQLHRRPQARGYRKTFFPNGCCIPGARKLFIDVDGNYHICERALGVPTIGSITDGIDFFQIKKIIEEYNERSFHDCKSCPVISTCGMCFMHAYECGEFNQERKRRACSGMRNAFNDRLLMYGYISKNYPYKLEEWDKVEMK